jgi:hypothetical protein
LARSVVPGVLWLAPTVVVLRARIHER